MTSPNVAARIEELTDYANHRTLRLGGVCYRHSSSSSQDPATQARCLPVRPFLGASAPQIISADETSFPQGETNVSKHVSEKDLLTKQQRKLVDDNIGLVGVHLRRHVPNLVHPRRDREYDDLFQEGCLGLMNAASRYDPGCGIPFAAYALARIRSAISKALRSKFTTVAMPRDDTARNASTKIHSDPQGQPRACVHTTDRPKVHSLLDDTYLQMQAPAPKGLGYEQRETIGDRLRGKYERAVRMAGEIIAQATSTRGDRARLVRLLTEERLLVPNAEARRALRQIARDTQSSYARVAQCEKKLSTHVRGLLECDPEFKVLSGAAREDPDGVSGIVDGHLQRRILSAGVAKLVGDFRRATRPAKAILLDALLGMTDHETETVIKRRFVRLPAEERERLLRKASGQ